MNTTVSSTLAKTVARTPGQRYKTWLNLLFFLKRFSLACTSAASMPHVKLNLLSGVS